MEIVMVGVPVLLVITFFILTVKTMKEVLPEADSKAIPDAIVTAHQWWWEVEYPATGVHAANEIHLPVGRKILLRFRSADVVHDWWVPQLGNKMDIVPGRENYLWLTIKKPGLYEGACSEFCGQQHAWMRIHVYAESPAIYTTWLTTHAHNAINPSGTEALLGATIFQQKSCGNCHRIGGTTAIGTAGPDLTHFASRHTILTGMLTNTTGNVDKWLADPQKVKPGAYMPDFNFDKNSRQALVTYLTQLK